MALISPARRFYLLARFVGGSKAARRLGVKVGDRCRIYSCQVASEHWLIDIGDDVTVSTEVLFITHDGTGSLFLDDLGRRYRYAPIRIGSRTFIGARATLLPGVSIGSDCIVGAGAVVAKSVPDGSIVVGNPARVIGKVADLKHKALREWPTEADRTGSSYAEKVNAIVERGYAVVMGE